MMNLVHESGGALPALNHAEFWRERITIPVYHVGEAARYADISAQSIAYWQRIRRGGASVLGPRARRAALSYLQLIEVGVVAAMRRSGVKLRTIEAARRYLSETFGTEYPFAAYRFKTDGKEILMGMEQFEGSQEADKLLNPGTGGQLGWNLILSRLLNEFDYSHAEDIVRLWRVAGENQPIRIDPAVAFGAPHVGGIATWALKQRWDSGESILEIADDYSLERCDVVAALKFEAVDVDIDRPPLWQN